jgi:hypothetical protein
MLEGQKQLFSSAGVLLTEPEFSFEPDPDWVTASQTRMSTDNKCPWPRDSIASDQDFSNSVSVPLGFVNSEITVPHPSGAQVYVKLRDDSAVVSIAAPPGDLSHH